MKAVNAGPIVMELDGDFRHRAASEAALALLGLPVEALLGRTSSEAGLPTEVVEPLERELAAAVEGGRERHLELEMPTIDGVRWLHLRLVPEPGPEGDPGEGGGPGEEGGIARVKILASDITARKHAELRLSGENAAFRALVEDSADLIARIDSDLRVTFVNREIERVTGRTAGAFLGRQVGALGLGEEMAGRWEEAVHAVFASGEPRSLDFRLVAPEGPRWYSARLLPEPGPERRVGYVIVSCTDVTDRIEREAEQAALRRVATVVAREGDLEEIARVAAQETALLLDATGSAVYRFESGEEATCVAAHPPAGPGAVISPVVALTGGHGDRRDRPHRPAGAGGRLPRRPLRPVHRGGAGGRPAQRHRRPPLGPRPAVGGADGRIGAARRPSEPATSGAFRPSPSSRRSPWPTPRRAPSWPTWPTPTRSPGWPTAGPSASAWTARSCGRSATGTC